MFTLADNKAGSGAFTELKTRRYQRILRFLFCERKFCKAKIKDIFTPHFQGTKPYI